MGEGRRHLTEIEIADFLRAARRTRNGVRDYCISVMAYRHGLRVSEITEMRLDQIELGSARFFTRRMKNGIDTTHVIEGDELRAIRAWLRLRSIHKMAQSDLVFLSNRGPMTRQAVNYLVAVIGRKAKITIKVFPHMLRHACGFTLANNNTATATIQEYLGHRSIQNTAVYVAQNTERFRNMWRRSGRP